LRVNHCQFVTGKKAHAVYIVLKKRNYGGLYQLQQISIKTPPLICPSASKRRFFYKKTHIFFKNIEILKKIVSLPSHFWGLGHWDWLLRDWRLGD
jgi:hypothetical protein